MHFVRTRVENIYANKEIGVISIVFSANFPRKRRGYLEFFSNFSSIFEQHKNLYSFNKKKYKHSYFAYYKYQIITKLTH